MELPVKSPARRVLGSLTPRAINTPPRQHLLNSAEVVKNNTSPLKQVQTLSPQMAMDTKNQPPAGMLSAGRKRSIYEVDGVENMGPDATRARIARAVQMFNMPTPVIELASTEHMGPDIPVLHDKDDELTPTEPDTPEPVDEESVEEESVEEEPVSQETCASKGSFSDWVNWNVSSQPQQPVEPPPPAEPENPVKTRAETLRLKLQLASYKLRTDQIRTQFSDLEVPAPPAATPLLNNTSVTLSLSSEAQTITSDKLSSVRHDSAAVVHITANLDPGTACPKLQAGPVLLPTALSSRMISGSRQNVPSSPPAASELHPISVFANATYATPVVQRRPRDNESVDEEITPRGWLENVDEEREETVDERILRMRERRFEEDDLTSSVVKDRAASGLLALMKGQR